MTYVFNHLTHITAVSALSLLVLAGCSDDSNSLTTVDKPSVQVSSPSSGAIEIELPTIEKRAKSVTQQLNIRSSGEVDLTITKIEWVGEKPDRVFIELDRETIDESACSSDVYFIQSGSCVTTGIPDVPIKVAPSSEYNIPLVISAFGDGEVNAIKCPEAGDDVPAQFKARYCGALRVTTDGVNDVDGTVVGGVATVYLQADQTQGNLSYSSPSVAYENVRPGYEEVRMLSVTNNSDEPVELVKIAPTGFSQYLAVEGANDLPKSLPANGIQEFQLRLKLPAEITQEALEAFANTPGLALQITSSAPDSPKNLPIAIDTSVAVPSIPLLNQERLEFAGDQDVQEFTITNPGSQTLRIRGISVEPRSADSFYEFFIDDNGSEKILGSSPITIRTGREDDPTRNIQVIKVRYKAQPQGSALASAVVNYGYDVGNEAVTGTARLALMGEEKNVAFGDLSNTSFTFSTSPAGEVQSATVVLNNLGTAALEVTEAVLSSQIPNAPTDEVELLADNALAETFTVPAGESKSLTVRYTPANNDIDRVTIQLKSNTGGEALEIQVNSLVAETPMNPFKFVTSFTTNEPMSANEGKSLVYADPAFVNELLTFELAPDVPKMVSDSMRWSLLEKPEGSNVYIKSGGRSLGIFPDKVGTYKILVSAGLMNFTPQQVVEFTTVEKPN